MEEATTEGSTTGNGVQRVITDDLAAIFDALPQRVVAPLKSNGDYSDILEIILDLGRPPEARFPGRELVLSEHPVTEADINEVVQNIGEFGEDNRAGIERTLHRISAIRNRKGKIVGLTCRIGRSVFGTIDIIRDIVESGQNILMLGRPGVGKTTMLREIARVLAEDFRKRVVVVDTSNEIAGDGDVPHPAIGRARRMQVATPSRQHSVMIEAVENHMPEVIVIDEIGTELEAEAARTIAERGVQLVGTAHGNSLENIMMNPTLADLVGGIQTVTLSDEEARRRGTQKSVLERKAPPTFDVIVEIQSWDEVSIHASVAETVDEILRGRPIRAELREQSAGGTVHRRLDEPRMPSSIVPNPGETPIDVRPDNRRDRRRDQSRERYDVPMISRTGGQTGAKRIYPFGISRSRLQQSIRELQVPAYIVDSLDEADLVMTLKSYYRQRNPGLRDAESRGVPIYVIKQNTVMQMEQSLGFIFDLGSSEVDPVQNAIRETEQAIDDVMQRQEPVDLAPQNSFVRRLQHELVERYHLNSVSTGREPHRRVRIFRDDDERTTG